MVANLYTNQDCEREYRPNPKPHYTGEEPNEYSIEESFQGLPTQEVH